MPYNGSGGWTRIHDWTTDAAASVPIDAGRFDAETDDMAFNGLGKALVRDGQALPTANLPMAGFRHTGVGNAVNRSDYLSAAQYQDGAIIWGGTGGGTADAITLTLAPALTAYGAGKRFAFLASGVNTGAVTLNINGLGTRTIKRAGPSSLLDLAAGDIPYAGAVVHVIDDGTQFQLLRPGQRGYVFIGVETFSANGTFTKNDTDAAYVRAIAGGGGGGGTAATGASTVAAAGGGGAGEYREGFFTSLGTTETITIGAAGAGAAAGANSGGTGGNTSFGALLSCIGGDGGLGSAATSSDAVGSVGGLGGTGGSGGSVNAQGGSGLAGLRFGSSGTALSGAGGDGYFGGGAKGNQETAGVASGAPGGGGSGASAGFSAGARAGGAGGLGRIIVFRYRFIG